MTKSWGKENDHPISCEWNRAAHYASGAEEDPAALKRLGDLAVKHGVPAVDVLAFYLQEKLLIGYRSAETTGTKIQTLLDQPLTIPAATKPCLTMDDRLAAARCLACLSQ